jgi:putative endonuclease
LNLIKIFSDKSITVDKDTLGKLGESYSVQYLKKMNYHIVETNYRSRMGEIDIIARDKDSYVFVEVKTREEHLTFGKPIDAVNPEKQNRIRRIADSYLDKLSKTRWKECRFDIIEVVVRKTGDLININHIPDAF